MRLSMKQMLHQRQNGKLSNNGYQETMRLEAAETLGELSGDALSVSGGPRRPPDQIRK